MLQYRDGNRGLVIEVSPRYGHPSVLTYKVVQAVFRKVTLEGKIIAKKDIEFAKRLIDAIGTEGFTDLVEFALEEAPKTNFQMKNIRAIETCLPAW